MELVLIIVLYCMIGFTIGYFASMTAFAVSFEMETNILRLMFLFGALGFVTSFLYLSFVVPNKFNWRRVWNSGIAWFISVPVGCALLPWFNDNVFIAMWYSSSLIMVIRDYTIQDSILVGSLNGLFWLVATLYYTLPC
jgi:hypothetical protein